MKKTRLIKIILKRTGALKFLTTYIIIFAGVSIGEYCVIAAGSVVTKSVDDYHVVGGNPAKILKVYNKELGVWEKTSSSK